MTINLLQTPEYQALITEHISNTIGYLFSKQQQFGVACEVKHLHFEPELPKELKDGFNDTVLFILSGYTLDSAILEEDSFSFEAGFGPENFGSTVSMPLLAIRQILVGDNPIVLNLSRYEKPMEKQKVTTSKNSMEALLNNPENQKLLKKKS